MLHHQASQNTAVTRHLLAPSCFCCTSCLPTVAAAAAAVAALSSLSSVAALCRLTYACFTPSPLWRAETGRVLHHILAKHNPKLRRPSHLCWGSACDNTEEGCGYTVPS
jgi:hypothetical protein